MAAKSMKSNSKRDKWVPAVSGAVPDDGEDIRGRVGVPIDARKALLASVAGSVAVGLSQSPSPAITSAQGLATAAVDIAEEILKAAGIPFVEGS